MHILIIEDEELYADYVTMLIEKLEHDLVGVAPSAREALSLSEKQAPDLALIDINIEGEYDGIETAGLLRERFSELAIIFVTSLADDRTFARAARLGPVNYILKPFDQTQLARAVQLAVATKTNALESPSPAPAAAPETSSEGLVEGDYLYVKAGHRLTKLHLSDLLAVSADGHHCTLRYRNTEGKNKRYLLRIPLRDLRDRLPTTFLQVHRAHLVNDTHITSVDLREQVIHLTDGSTLPLAKRMKSIFLGRKDLLL